MGNYDIPTLLMLLFATSSYLVGTSCTSVQGQAGLTRLSFPKGFQFGTASSAYQYEGGTYGHGRGSSIWDTFTRTHPEKIADHSNGDIAEDFYNRFKEDIALMKYIGYDSFRFSISWSRLLPGGKISGGVNEEGVKFYNSLIDELLSNGIQPLVTLFHWDLPQALEDEYGGFLSPNIVNDYRDYVEFCFKEFGDRVKKWITFNEANIFAIGGYNYGVFAPGRCSSSMGNCSAGNSATEPYIVVHHTILAHAIAVNLYKHKYQVSQNGVIGITVMSHWMIPKYETTDSRLATLRALDFSIGWILDPIMMGDYPESMRSLVGSRLPKFSKEESTIVKGSIDFVGLNYYTTKYVEDASTTNSTIPNLSYSTDSLAITSNEKDGIPIGQSTAMPWLYIYPKGIEELTLHVTRKYNNLPIYITENGVVDNNTTAILKDALNDSLRTNYHHHHLLHLLNAIKGEADVRGYYAWSFLDNFEWASGYTIRFGIVYIDYKNKLQRHLKDSAFWFKNFLQNHRLIQQNPPLLSSH
ncbi:beta-glucosidase 12 [Cannabis sativa]|uniref:beta-glucosidase 12 n=1 Tax=Cannabis sativa TaxID=3483 RepID=UPI0029CA1571|nr:beta-glucosidase 12 [Cannabis sativa]